MRRVHQEALSCTECDECQKCQGKETSSHIALPANPHKYQKKNPFPRHRYRKSNKHQEKRPLPRRHHQQTPYKRQKETSSYSTTAETLTANPHKHQEKRPLPRRHYRNQQTPERSLFPTRHHRQMPIGKSPADAIPWQQGIIYSGGGARAHGFNYFLTLFL